jgi:hypothetical protein
MHIVQCPGDRTPFETAWADAAGHKNPPSAPPAIPPIIINPFNRSIPVPPPSDPLQAPPPGPPIMPPASPVLRM